jgi:hypothetical protein
MDKIAMMTKSIYHYLCYLTLLKWLIAAVALRPYYFSMLTDVYPFAHLKRVGRRLSHLVVFHQPSIVEVEEWYMLHCLATPLAYRMPQIFIDAVFKCSLTSIWYYNVLNILPLVTTLTKPYLASPTTYGTVHLGIVIRTLTSIGKVSHTLLLCLKCLGTLGRCT